MEVDCLEVVNLWISRRNSRSVAAPILQELEDRSKAFASFSVQHVGRSSNFSAHLCAKRACTLEVTNSWLCESPDFLVASLRADCNRLIIR